MSDFAVSLAHKELKRFQRPQCLCQDLLGQPDPHMGKNSSDKIVRRACLTNLSCPFIVVFGFVSGLRSHRSWQQIGP